MARTYFEDFDRDDGSRVTVEYSFAGGSETSYSPLSGASGGDPCEVAIVKAWTPEQLILYTFEALQSWSVQQGQKPAPEKTAREFCHDLTSLHPEQTDALRQLGFLHGHAAYATGVPPGTDVEFLRSLWQYLTAR